MYNEDKVRNTASIIGILFLIVLVIYAMPIPYDTLSQIQFHAPVNWFNGTVMIIGIIIGLMLICFNIMLLGGVILMVWAISDDFYFILRWMFRFVFWPVGIIVAIFITRMIDIIGVALLLGGIAIGMRSY